MKTSDFDFNLPQEFIAQTPVEPRDRSRLFVLDRTTDRIQHSQFYKIGEFLHPGDLLVLNETRVIPARLFARKETGGRVELLLLRRFDEYTWETLAGGKGLVVSRRLTVEGGPDGEIVSILEGARRVVRFCEPIEDYLVKAGHTPLPPYIHAPLSDPDRYQTVYARVPGSAAAPTAGLHFTPKLINDLKTQGIRFTQIILHIGMDTFAPITEDDPRKHVIHTEWCELGQETADAIRKTRQDGGRVIAVGTTSVRTLESAAQSSLSSNEVMPFSGPTNLFILPGYSFRVVDALITNFHLPRSTLIMLVSAFASSRQIKTAYNLAIEEGYRFYSLGDAMFIT
jgi:S-adenosylmethionine:tRNA ribosyltransferase-isomerase